MNSKYFILIILFSSFFFLGNGCGKRTYYQLITYDSPTPLVYEVIKDTTRLSSFVGIDAMQYNGYYEDEKIQIVRLNYQYSNTKKFSVENTCFQIIAGNYKVYGIDGNYILDSIYDGNKFGFGGRVSISGGLNFNIKGFRIGLGIEPSLNFDFGNFYSFRKNAGHLGVINSSADFIKLALNVFPYLSIPLGESSILNFQTNIGYPGFISPLLNFQFDDYILWIGYIQDRINLGLMINYNLIKNNL